MKLAIVASRFNDDITSLLVQGALDCITSHGGKTSADTVVSVPGAFELPVAADVLASSSRYDAIICLGAVIRGETPHFEYVSAECARGIQDVMLRRQLPVAFGVLTTNTKRQAKARAGGSMGNKGWDAASTAIEMVTMFRKLRRGRSSTKRR